MIAVRFAQRRGARLAAASPTVAAFAVAAGLMIGPAAQAQGDGFPARKPGLWEMKSSGGPLGGNQRMQQCIDARTDDLLRQQSEAGGQRCDKPKVGRSGADYQTEVVCRRDGLTTTMRGRYAMRGDTGYSGTMQMRFEPAMNGVSEMNMTVEGRWLGACKPGMKPGDVAIEGVPQTNLLNSEGAAPSRMSPEQLKALREEMERRMQQPSGK